MPGNNFFLTIEKRLHDIDIYARCQKEVDIRYSESLNILGNKGIKIDRKYRYCFVEQFLMDIHKNHLSTEKE